MESSSPSPSEVGFSLPELLLAVGLLVLLSALGLVGGGRWLAGQRLEAATRLVLVGLERGRQAAEQRGTACGLTLTAAGWQAPSGGALPACLPELQPLEEALGGGVSLQHNLPSLVRFTANGLVLDGGTVRLQQAGTPLERCVVVALPLGITRLGDWRGGSCEPI